LGTLAVAVSSESTRLLGSKGYQNCLPPEELAGVVSQWCIWPGSLELAASGCVICTNEFTNSEPKYQKARQLMIAMALRGTVSCLRFDVRH